LDLAVAGNDWIATRIARKRESTYESVEPAVKELQTPAMG